ncbi:hypothetical protein BH11PSE2_BH11PSE2_02550 [soil metagenome]
MTDEAAEIQRRIAYITEVRKIASLPRSVGFACCLVGAVLIIWASYRVPGGAFSPFGLTALAVIIGGWLLFAYSIFQRTRYVRAHPFEPKA